MIRGIEREALVSILASNPRVDSVALSVDCAATAGNTFVVAAKPEATMAGGFEPLWGR